MYFGVKRYIEERGYAGLKALVAFSCEVTLEGETYTEARLNGFSETELPKRFDGDDYQLLIVAEKYQTGFDQPKLCAMYVDRKLAGLQTVQTLSRLNRTAAGKRRTYILDFQNTIDEVRDAFKPYYEAAALEDVSDPHQVYSLESNIRKFGIIDQEEVERFAAKVFAGRLDARDRPMLEGLVRQAAPRFTSLEDDGRREEFRQLCHSFMRFYAFISQVVTLDDPRLEKLYAYLSWFLKLLPDSDVPPDAVITDDMLDLKAFRIERKEEGSASLKPGDTAALTPIREFGAKPMTEDEAKLLSELVKTFNERHGTTFTREDFDKLEKLNARIISGNMGATLRNNPSDVSFRSYEEEFFKELVADFQRSDDFKNIVLVDAEMRKQVIKYYHARAVRSVREA